MVMKYTISAPKLTNLLGEVGYYATVSEQDTIVARCPQPYPTEQDALRKASDMRDEILDDESGGYEEQSTAFEGEGPSYRAAMRDAGRGHLLR